MTDFVTFYNQFQPDISLVTDQLYKSSMMLLIEEGDFLPHAAMLTEGGKVVLMAGSPGKPEGLTNSTEVLPPLHEGLRRGSREQSLKAVGVAENVTVKLPGQGTTQAIKVLFEHKSGLTIRFYYPFTMDRPAKFIEGKAVAELAEPEVNAWA